MIDYTPHLEKINDIAIDIANTHEGLSDFQIMMSACDVYIKQQYDRCYELINQSKELINDIQEKLK